ALDKAYSLILEVEIDDDLDLSQQIEDLRFTISKRIVEIYASRFTVVNGSHKAIPLVMNRHVKHELDSFKGKERNFFIKTYHRSGRYRPAMVRALKAAGLPKELSWLPLIESGFRVRAFSRARALGLWQFIASTGYRYGLKRDAYIDERMDPEKSTDAAIAYLKELHHMFGDWTTALAAYNCGERTVLNSIRKQRINYLDNFWDLYERLPRETAAYVPRFLAVLHILNDPAAHDVSLPPVDEGIRVEEVTISKKLHLKTIARSLDIDYALLQNINAELRQNLTPNEPYSLKLPYGKGELLLSKLNDIPVWQAPVPAYSVHKVQNGESLSQIAEKYKTSVKAIMAMNGLKRKDYLLVGWRLRIPTKGSTAVARLIRPPIQSKRLKGGIVTYVVKKGDSLWQIARKFGTTTKIIQSINQIKNPHLMIGQVLKIPVGLMGSGTYKTQPYRVKKGDSPSLIAKKCRMNLSQFLKLNRLTPRSTIFPGQILRVMAK
ncbi:MAG: LysM peptidoglycan-binding domain-containing protein, partial [Pseudomonadota bacterium]